MLHLHYVNDAGKQLKNYAAKYGGTGVYHVMMCGINRQRIFEDTEDRYPFLQCLSDGQQLQCLDKEQRNAILSGISFQIFQKLF